MDIVKRHLPCSSRPFPIVPMDVVDENKNNSIIKQGYCRHRGRGRFQKWTKKWVILYDSVATYTKSIRLYKDERDAKEEQNSIRIPLDNVEDIILSKQKDKSKVTIVFMHHRNESFAFPSEHENTEWYDVLNLVCFGSVLGRVAKETLDARKRSLPYYVADEQFQDGALSDEEKSDTFNVHLQPSLKLNIHGDCLLQVSPTQLKLLDVRSPTVSFVTWELGSLRRYGYDTSRFTFESGRRCSTGEGIFVFKTDHGEAIHNRLQTETERMANDSARSRSNTFDSAGYCTPITDRAAVKVKFRNESC